MQIRTGGLAVPSTILTTIEETKSSAVGRDYNAEYIADYNADYNAEYNAEFVTKLLYREYYPD